MDSDIEMPASKSNQLPDLNYVQLTDNEEEYGCFPSLNIQTRVMGLIVSYLLGFLIFYFLMLDVGSLLQVYAIYSDKDFYINFIAGNAFYLLGLSNLYNKNKLNQRLLFVVHFKTQKEQYNRPFTKVALAMYIGSVLLLLFLNNVFLFELIFFILEEWQNFILLYFIFRGYLWYLATYAPFLRKFLAKNFSQLCQFE